MLYKIINQLVDISPASYLKRTTRSREQLVYPEGTIVATNNYQQELKLMPTPFFHLLLNYGTI